MCCMGALGGRVGVCFGCNISRKAQFQFLFSNFTCHPRSACNGDVPTN